MSVDSKTHLAETNRAQVINAIDRFAASSGLATKDAARVNTLKEWVAKLSDVVLLDSLVRHDSTPRGITTAALKEAVKAGAVSR